MARLKLAWIVRIGSGEKSRFFRGAKGGTLYFGGLDEIHPFRIRYEADKLARVVRKLLPSTEKVHVLSFPVA